MKNRALFKFTKFSLKQKMVLEWWCDGSPYKDKDGIIADGSIRAGKTTAMSFSFIMWSMDTFSDENFAMCGKTINSLRRNVLKQLKRILISRGYKYVEHRSENYITISMGDVSNDYYLFGGKDEASQDLIQGITLAGVFFDEVALMPESFVNQAVGRCSVEESKFWFNCNPDNPNHYFKKSWIDELSEKNLIRIHFTMEDNPALSPKTIKRYMSLYSGIFYERFVKGLWVRTEGIIYDSFNKDRHVLTQKDIDKLEFEDSPIVSSDFGIQNATVFLYWRKIKGKNAWVCLDEYYYSGRDEHKQKSVKELIDGLKGLCVRNTTEAYRRLHEVEYENPKIVIIDPSASALIVEARKNGFKSRNADNDVLNGIADVHKMLNEERLYFADRCEHTIGEFNMYVWDEKASDRGEDKPIKEHDHAMDACRYFVYTLKLARKAKEDTTPRHLMFL